MFGFFTNKNDDEKVLTTAIQTVQEDENALIIAVDKEGRTILRLSIQNTDENGSEPFGKALFGIQSGFYKEQISDILSEIGASEKGERLEFVKEVLGYYTICFDMIKSLNYNKEDKPVVSPLKFSSLVNGDK
jgi:hypothetical protein